LIAIYASLHEIPLLEANELPEEVDAAPEEVDAAPAGTQALIEVMTDAQLYSVDRPVFVSLADCVPACCISCIVEPLLGACRVSFEARRGASRKGSMQMWKRLL